MEEYSNFKILAVCADVFIHGGRMITKNAPKNKDQSKNWNRINPDTAGIDIGSKSHFVAIPADRDPQHVREFQTFTNSLIDLVNWLKEKKIKSVAMESTGVYWIPVYDLLEQHGFEVLLVNARHIKNVPGRKTDVQDCQWIQQLHSYGLLSGSFRPKDLILKMRVYMRHRAMLIEYGASHIQHMQKALSLMNLQLHNVISDITGSTGMNIIRDIIRGERDPVKLAAHRDGRCKNPETVIRESLIGNYSEEHIFCLRQSVALYDFYAEEIEKCDVEIQKLVEKIESMPQGKKATVKEQPLDKQQSKKTALKRDPHKHGFKFNMAQEMQRVTGVNLTAIPGLNVQTIAVIISEVGVDMNKWKTSKHFAAWLGLCPRNKISGGKILSSKTCPSANKAAAALRKSANSLYKADCALGGFFRRMRSRLGAPKAITATAHKLAVILYNMLKNGLEFIETGAKYYEEQYRTKCVKNLRRRANELGFEITPVAV
jgi:transposase